MHKDMPDISRYYAKSRQLLDLLYQIFKDITLKKKWYTDNQKEKEVTR